jgi:hypothetical protein
MRSLRLVSVVVIVCAAAAPSASAKDGVRAKLDRPVRLDTASGKRIQVAWHLFDRHGDSFGAGGIYLRVWSCGRRLTRIRAAQVGDGYEVRLRVPRGGIRRLSVGLEGWQFRRGHKPRRADAIFQFAPRLQRDC